tara:strand:- start:501 stop:776 length:276 start_codon:yes stop_codon:yes gene_type:complete
MIWLAMSMNGCRIGLRFDTIKIVQKIILKGPNVQTLPSGVEEGHKKSIEVGPGNRMRTVNALPGEKVLRRIIASMALASAALAKLSEAAGQ